MEMERVPAAGYDITGLPVSGFDRHRLWRNFAVLLRLWKSLRMARKILREFKPQIAIGVGGFASGPMLKAAQRKGIPTVIQEQNSYAGVTNKLLAKKADAICVAYPGMERFFPADKITMTGNPVRSHLADTIMSQQEAKSKLGFDPARPVIMVTGGSLGARTINESIAASLDKITSTGAQILWQTGKLYADECAAIAQGYDGVMATPFISDMAIAYRAADMTVSRAGAGTISELQLVGMPSILVPSPNVAEDHQRKNAQALALRDAAIMIPDADARAEIGNSVTALLADGKKRNTLSRNIRKMALANADERITDIIVNILNSVENV